MEAPRVEITTSMGTFQVEVSSRLPSQALFMGGMLHDAVWPAAESTA